MTSQREGAGPWVPDGRSLARLRSAAADCRGCELWADATQTVFSSGLRGASLLLVGEQPGDAEDREGEPFVGPAGRVLDEALDQAGIDRTEVYLTNAVKHFRHVQRGKRRIHEKPAVSHITACHPWLEREVALVHPRLIVALGAVAARASLGRSVKIGCERGSPLLDEPKAVAVGIPVIVTSHPSAVLRLRQADDPTPAHREFAALIADLVAAREYCKVVEH